MIIIIRKFLILEEAQQKLVKSQNSHTIIVLFSFLLRANVSNGNIKKKEEKNLFRFISTNKNK